ncbi:hypothetical protein P7C73_g353, partial [Tremellales sp. Uapishka_1]
MAPSFTLKSFSPSRATLTLPTAQAAFSSSPLASPACVAGRFAPTSPDGSQGLGYFRPVNKPAPSIVTKEDAFKTVKAMEDVLSAWNEYRVAIASLGKAGKKLAAVLKDLVGCMDKTEIPAQTIKPTAAMLEMISDITGRLAKKMDKEYDDANSDASKYFTLLAKESRTHEAYLGVIGKKHDKAEKAYRKASKNLADTSNAHFDLLALKDTLSEDISRAHDDHLSMIGTKQSTLLLRLASSASVLSGSLLSFFSEGLRKSATSYRDVEYFGALADARWQGSLPSDLDEKSGAEKREELRLQKARVALGERDVVGEGMWNDLKNGPVRRDRAAPERETFSNLPQTQIQTGSTVDTTVAYTPEQASALSSSKISPIVAATKSFEESPLISAEKAELQVEQPSARLDGRIEQAKPPEAATRHPLRPQLFQGQKARVSFTSDSSFREDTSAKWSPTSSHSRHETQAWSPRPAPTQSHSSYGDHHHPSYRDHHHSPQTFHQDPQQASISSMVTRPSHSSRASSIAIPGVKRSVSQIAADMERHNAYEVHRSHISGYVRGCALCSMDYDRMLNGREVLNSHSPPPPLAPPLVDLRAQRRTTMPPAYPQPYDDSQPSRSSGRPEWPTEHRRVSYQDIAAPRPQRSHRISPDLHEFGR